MQSNRPRKNWTKTYMTSCMDGGEESCQKIILCFWAVSEVGMSLGELARAFEMIPPVVGFSVERGETIARKNANNPAAAKYFLWV